MEATALFLPEAFAEAKEELLGTDEDREETCTTFVLGRLGLSLAKTWSPLLCGEDCQKGAKALLGDLKKGLKATLPKSDGTWLEPPQMMKALEKIEEIELELEYELENDPLEGAGLCVWRGGGGGGLT